MSPEGQAIRLARQLAADKNQITQCTLNGFGLTKKLASRWQLISVTFFNNSSNIIV